MRLNITLACLILATPLFASERRDVGLTQKGTVIQASIVDSPSSTTVLLIGGMNGNDDTSKAVAREAETFEAIPQNRRPFKLIAIAVANPDSARMQFPPT